MTVADLTAALAAYPPETPVGIRASGPGVVPVVLEPVELRGPHAGWGEESGLLAIGFELGSSAAAYHERRGGVLVKTVLVGAAGGLA